VRLRPATELDLPALVAIETASFSDPWSLRSFEKLLVAHHAIVTVAEQGDGSVGGFTVVLLAADEAELANIAVSPARRGAGVGRQLLAAALDMARDAGAGTVYLEVRPSNARARALYAAAGFEEVGRRRQYYTSPAEDALVLSCGLGPP
jgi:[ribosomal protein S18]-alanine N-acetyltransferase